MDFDAIKLMIEMLPNVVEVVLDNYNGYSCDDIENLKLEKFVNLSSNYTDIMF